MKGGFDYVLMLNNDTFVEPDFLDHLVAFLDKNPQTAAVQPRIHYHHDRSKLWNGGNLFYPIIGWTFVSGENKLPAPQHLKRKNIDWITGCAFLVRTDVLTKTGLFAENMFLYLKMLNFLLE